MQHNGGVNHTYQLSVILSLANVVQIRFSNPCCLMYHVIEFYDINKHKLFYNI